MSDEKVLEIESIRAAGHVKRWHRVPIVGQQTDAEHSGQAVSLLLLLHPNPSMSLVKAMLWHDSSEIVMGDVPSPARKAFPDFGREYELAEIEVMRTQHPSVFEAVNALTNDDWLWLRAIDLLELLMFCSDQVMLGNRPMAVVRERALGYLLSGGRCPPEVHDFARAYMEQPGGPRSFA